MHTLCGVLEGDKLYGKKKTDEGARNAGPGVGGGVGDRADCSIK